MDGIDRRTFLRVTATAGAVAVAGVTVGTGVAAAAVPGFYNPFTGYPITETWEGHLARGSLGGIDYGMPVGTRLPAAGGGVVYNDPDNGTGGYTAVIHHDNGYKTQYLHLSGFVVANGTRVAMGDIVGLSGGYPGAPGSGSSTGPHLHWHMNDPSGTRINPLAFLGGDAPPGDTQVFETAHNSGWQPLPVASIVASKVSAVLRADGTKIIYSVRDGYVYEAASNAGWRNLRVPNLAGVSAISAIAVGSGVVLYTIRSGALWECASGDWVPFCVGYNGSPIYADAVSAVLRSDGTRIVYTVRDGAVFEAASNAGWRNLRVPNLDSVAAVSAISRNGTTTLYTIRAGTLWEASSVDWRLYAVGYNGSPIYANAVSALHRPDGTRIVYTVRDGAVFEAASNAGWRNLRVPNLGGVGAVSAIYASGTEILYTR
ncbi:Peptidase family M23 [Micromonospora pallida]|uniref:Peptidase family M23 n=1 Tax=Micromonospora pallida TaxID=145854 RepID=A0A1C6SK30_9ACTN|nr:M23 family metallopeptidase [Micromonospora pallida]SCL29609.1 Peptidase family M23 [Micromonospora pallida]